MGRLDDEHIGGKFLLLLGDVLTTLLLTLGTALAWLSVYILPGDPLMDLGAVIACCAAASVASAALLTWRHGLWAASALLGAGGLTCWRLWEKLAEGWLLGRPPSLLDLLEKYPATLYLLCALLALVMGLAAVKARAWYLAALLSVAPVLPAIIGGTLPMWGAMLASFSAWGAMLLTSRFSRRNPVGLGRAKMVSLAGMWGMILLLVMALPMDGYLRPQWATDARNDLIRGVTTRMERYFDMDSLPLLADLGLDRLRSEELTEVGMLYAKLYDLCLTEGSELFERLNTVEGLMVDRIFIRAGEDREAARERVAEVFSRLNSAEDPAAAFPALAAEGDDTAGPRTLLPGDGSLPPSLEEAAQALKEGQFSGILESEEGFSILRRLAAEGTAPTEEAFDQLLQAAAREALVKTVPAYDLLDAAAFDAASEELRAAGS